MVYYVFFHFSFRIYPQFFCMMQPNLSSCPLCSKFHWLLFLKTLTNGNDLLSECPFWDTLLLNICNFTRFYWYWIEHKYQDIKLRMNCSVQTRKNLMSFTLRYRPHGLGFFSLLSYYSWKLLDTLADFFFQIKIIDANFTWNNSNFKLTLASSIREHFKKIANHVAKNKIIQVLMNFNSWMMMRRKSIFVEPLLSKWDLDIELWRNLIFLCF